MILAKRNLTLYLQDKLGVIFSLLGVLIIILLYIIFLADSLENNMDMVKDASLTVDVWLVAGILQVASMTTSIGSLSVLIQDRLSEKNKDFYMLPIRKRHVSTSYFLTAYIIGILMTLVTFVFCCFYLYLRHGYFIGISSILTVLATTLLTSFTSAGISYLIAAFLTSNSAFSAVSTIIGTLIGFLTGIYFPIGSVSDSVQKAMTIFPLTHGASLFRKILMTDMIKTDLKDAPALYQQEFSKHLGIDLYWNTHELSIGVSIAYLLLFGLAVYLLASMIMKRRDEVV